MKSPVKPRLMRILLDGEPHSGIDLATGVGFTKVATIRKAIDSFERAGFIVRQHLEGRTDYCCRLNCTRDAILKIYSNPEFHALRPEIRKAEWFCPVFTHQFNGLPDNLPLLIDEMARASHTFFETICLYDSPDKIRETYQHTLLVNRLSGISDPAFDDLYMYYQIFLHGVIRDIRYGGLGEGFAQLLTRTQERIEQRYPSGRVTPSRKRVSPVKRGTP